MKQAREFTAAQQISAYIVLRPDGTECAKIHTHYSVRGEGRCTVTIYNYGKGNDQIPQTANTGGFGYDKETAAMSGLWVDGHYLSNHCEISLKNDNGWDRSETEPLGFDFANFRDGVYTSCHRKAGLDVLKAFGYRVLRAI